MGKNILIIEDNALSRNMLQMALEQVGYKVIIAVNGNEGVEKTKNQTIDLVLLDLILPGLDGFGVLSILKSNPETKNIPVLVLTGRDSREEKEKAVKLGALDCLVKYQLSHAQLLAIIKQVFA